MQGPYAFAVIGAGIAGASLAAGLAGKGRVIVLEAEDRPGYHATGRSAAFWTESYGGEGVVPLTLASGPFLRAHDLLRPRGALTLGTSDERAGLEQFAAQFLALGVRMEVLGRATLEQRIPGLKSAWCHGVLEPDCCDIDVAALHQLWLGEAARHGAEIACRARLVRGERRAGAWLLTLEDGRQVEAGVVIDAAGAWADAVAASCGVQPLEFAPLRRTIAQLDCADRVPVDLPLTLGFDGSFYFKPEGARLWLSPHDEVPSPPCDAAPEEIDLARAVARFEQVVDWPVRRIEHKWAGLRTFAPDRLPVYGFDPDHEGFFWFAGQGGFGIQTAPAAAELALALLCGKPGSAIDPATYSPARFR